MFLHDSGGLIIPGEEKEMARSIAQLTLHIFVGRDHLLDPPSKRLEHIVSAGHQGCWDVTCPVLERKPEFLR